MKRRKEVTVRSTATVSVCGGGSTEYTWFAKENQDLTSGDNVRLEGTFKERKFFRGKTSYELTRCKVAA